jgi:esterase/lipase
VIAMRACIALGAACVLGLATSATGADFGVIVLHGKSGSPSRHVPSLVSALEAKGYLVSVPTMAWAGTRMYDATFDQAMAEIDREADALRRKGAKWIVVAGHSMGANAALGYGASRESVHGVIALAPGHAPESATFANRLGADVKRARELVAAGKAKAQQSFSDVNQGRAFSVMATPEAYLSWFDPEGTAVMPKSAAALKQSTALLVVEGSRDRLARGRGYIFDQAPAHPKNRFVTIDADHLEVPTVAIDEVAGWLASLRQ